jgi:plasmid replication initiation protein
MAKKKVHKGITLIKKSNNLVESRYKFDIWETRFFLSVLSQIRRDDTDFQVYRIWYKDVIKTFGLKSGDSYASLREASKSLMGKSVHINYETDGVKRGSMVHLIRKVDYLEEGQKNVESHEYIDVTVEQDLRPLLLQLQKNFTAYDLRNVIKLGVYSVRLYELLKQYESIGARTLKVDQMKSMFDLSSEYERYNDFYRWVIVPAEKEINAHTDLLIQSIEKVKEGRRVVALRFKFRTKTDQELSKIRDNPFKDTLFDGTTEADFDEVEVLDGEDQAPVEEVQTEKDKLFLAFQPVVVGEFGVSPTVFLAELEHYNQEQISQAVRVTERAKKDGKVKNLSGFFMEALRKGFTDTKEETAKKKVKEDERKAQDTLIKEQIMGLEDELASLINDKIRALTSSDPSVTEKAIDGMTDNPAMKTYISNKEKTLQRLLEVEDYRTDKMLRSWVKKRIIEANEEEFQPIFASYETKINTLKEGLSRPL